MQQTDMAAQRTCEGHGIPERVTQLRVARFVQRAGETGKTHRNIPHKPRSSLKKKRITGIRKSTATARFIDSDRGSRA